MDSPFMEQLGGARDLVIGGKSMGGRIASLVADELAVRGLICLGYPFHPPGRPQSRRIARLEDGDHSFKPRKSSDFTQEEHIQRAAEAVAAFCRRL